jgi:hypothetical protein
LFVGIALEFGLFTAWLYAMPLSLGIFVGFQITREKSLRAGVKAWLSFLVVTLLPFVAFIVVLPTVYQILSIALITLAFVLGLHFYRKISRSWSGTHLSHSGISPLRRVVGFSLIIVGLVLFLILIPFLMPLGLSGALLLTWLVVICVVVGSFILSRVELRVAVKSFFVVLALSIPWFAIFLLPLPNDIQLLLAVSVAGIAVLIYRYYTKSRSSEKQSHKG